MQVQINTSKGNIVLELNQGLAPVTTQNFISYVEKGFYVDTIFHRVIPNFMIQGGGLDANMKTKPTDATIKNEANNGLRNTLGTVAMARANAPHSASSQFFINTKDNPFLDFKAETAYEWGYCVFGKVIEGMDVTHAIEKIATIQRAGHNDVPEEVIKIIFTEVVSP